MDKQRRKFIRQSGAAAAALATLPTMAWPPQASNDGSEKILKKLSQINDANIQDLLSKQLNIPGDRWDGGVVNNYDLPNVHSTCWFIIPLGSAYACQYSDYYLSAKLEKPLERAINCMLNVQYEDGTIDLHSTNFHSTPDTAFLVNYLSPVYIGLKRLNRPGLDGFISKVELFLRNAGKCLVVGGIHTANHRWVVCSALARVNSFFPDKKYVNRIDEWLGEGIDLDPDGQYTEQSVSIYSPTCDNMFLTTGRLLNRPELLDVVRKNLEMTLYYIQPGGEVLTDASGRQDSARIGYVDAYYYAYRYFAIKDNNPVFSQVCTLIEQEMPEKITRFISLLREDPIFKQDVPAPAKIPDDYFKRFSYSGVFRIRRGNADVSIIEKNPTFLSFMKGHAVMQSMRLGAAFFGSRGQFIGEKCEVLGEKIILSKTHTHGYFQPYPKEKISGDGDFEKMRRYDRKMSEVQTINYQVSITESKGKVSIDIDIDGTDNVPVSLEMTFRKGGELSGLTPDKNNEDIYFLEKGTGEYRIGKDVIKIANGTTSHKWAQMRGMLPKQEGIGVYITGYTPFKHTVELS